jgi:tripartite-type tricarboxylate transporter receptor subunit TctC
VDALFDAMPGVLGQIRDGKLRALAVSTLQRSAFLPDVPTISETVAPGFNAAGWIGIAAPAKTPATIVGKLYSEIVKALADPETKHRMADLAFTPVSSTPDEFSAFIRAEVRKWARVVKDAGASVD